MLANTYLDQFAKHRYPKRGKCKNSCFANGWHRVGMVPVLSVLDGGLPGDSAVEICLECEKVFSRRAFYPKSQPRQLTPNAVDRAGRPDKTGRKNINQISLPGFWG